MLHTEERVYTAPPLSCRQTELSSDVAQQWPKRECYTQTSQMRVQLQGYVDSSVVYLSLGNVNLGERGHVSSFPRWGPVLNLRNNFQILQIKGLQISAWSLHTQNGMRSDPVAVFFRCCKQFHTCLSEISGTWTPLSTWAVALIALYTITKNRFCHLRPPRDSDKLCILLQGFVWETYVSDMKTVHKIRS